MDKSQKEQEKLRRKQVNDKLKAMRLQRNRASAERMISNLAPLAKKKGEKLLKKAEGSKTISKLIEKGTKATVQSWARQEGEEVDQDQIKVGKEQIQKSKKYFQ